MNQKRLSRYLILAGALALAGIVFLFFGMGLFVLLSRERASAQETLLALIRMGMGIPYLLALRQYFFICVEIGNDRSFSVENARRMKRIGRVLLLAAALWAILMAVGAICSIVPGDTGFLTHPLGGAALYVRMGLALLASLAVGLVARVMALLVARACRLQEENDLTI